MLAGTAHCSLITEGGLGSHSPSTWCRDRYLRASSSRMTGRDIWSTTPHWRPLSGVTWKMSCGGGWLKEGLFLPPGPPAHPPDHRDPLKMPRTPPEVPPQIPVYPLFLLEVPSQPPLLPPGPIPLVLWGSGRDSAPGKSIVCPPVPPWGTPSLLFPKSGSSRCGDLSGGWWLVMG